MLKRIRGDNRLPRKDGGSHVRYKGRGVMLKGARTFSCGEGGPLAVDEEIILNRNLIHHNGQSRTPVPTVLVCL